MNQKERIFIIIDGSNFYHRLKELGLARLLDFEYQKLSKFLTKGNIVVLKKYYIGAIREEKNNLKSRHLMKGQQRLIGKLKSAGWEIVFGHMLKTNGYHEKGVDIQIAVDILVGAYENLYDTVFLISSDTDLLPALKKAQELKKKMVYIGFSHRPSYGLIACANETVFLRKQDLANML